MTTYLFLQSRTHSKVLLYPTERERERKRKRERGGGDVYLLCDDNYHDNKAIDYTFPYKSQHVIALHLILLLTERDDHCHTETLGDMQYIHVTIARMCNTCTDVCDNIT